MNRRLFGLVVVGLSALLLLAPSAANAQADEPKPKRLLLLGQKPDGHPAGTHEYMAGQRILKAILERVPGTTGTPAVVVEIVQADGPWTEGPEMLDKADGVVLFVSEGAKWISADPRRYEAFAKLAARGGGLSAIHWGIGTKDPKNIEPFTRLFGACHGGPDRKYKFTDFDVALPDAAHPICSGIKPLRVHEEFYFALKRPKDAGAALTPLLLIGDADAVDDDAKMVSWAYERPDAGRSFGFSGLHFHKNWQREDYRRFLAQGVLWTIKLPPPKAGLDVSVPETLLEP